MTIAQPAVARAGRPFAIGCAIVLFVAKILLFAGAVRNTLLATHPTDFFIFLRSANNFLQGIPDLNDSFYGPNLNHPIVTLALLPLTLLAPVGAYYLWMGIGLCAYVLAVIVALREMRLLPQKGYRAITLALVLTFPGLFASLQVGQFGTLLMVPITLVWLLLRRGRILPAAGIIGMLGMLKPFLFLLLLLFLVRRQWRALLVAACGALVVALIPLPIMGLDAYRRWFSLITHVDYYGAGWNISFAGLVYRAVVTPPPGTTWLLVLLTGVIALLLIGRPPAPETNREERDFLVLVPLAILGSPLGWLYYTPLALPTIVGVVRRWSTLSLKWRAAIGAGAILFWSSDLLALFISGAAASRAVSGIPTLFLLFLVAALVVPPRPIAQPVQALVPTFRA